MTVQFSQLEYRIQENSIWLSDRIAITRIGDTSKPCEVKFGFRAKDSSATIGKGKDIERSTQTMTWEAGDSSTKYPELQINQDLYDEFPEFVVCRLYSAKGVKVGSIGECKLYIQDVPAKEAGLEDVISIEGLIVNNEGKQEKVKIPDLFGMIKGYVNKIMPADQTQDNQISQSYYSNRLNFAGIAGLEGYSNPVARITSGSWGELICQNVSKIVFEAKNLNNNALIEARLGSPGGAKIGQTTILNSETWNKFEISLNSPVTGTIYLMPVGNNIDFEMRSLPNLISPQAKADAVSVIEQRFIIFSELGVKKIKVKVSPDINYLDTSKGIEIHTWSQPPKRDSLYQYRKWLNNLKPEELADIRLNDVPAIGFWAWDKRNNMYSSSGFWRLCKVDYQTENDVLLVTILGA